MAEPKPDDKELLDSIAHLRKTAHAINNSLQTLTSIALVRGLNMEQELKAEIGGQKLSLKNMPINTMATVATLMFVGVIAYGGWVHMADTKIASGELVQALKEQTATMRESNCLQSYRGPDDQKAGFCRQVSR